MQERSACSPREPVQRHLQRREGSRCVCALPPYRLNCPSLAGHPFPFAPSFRFCVFAWRVPLAPLLLSSSFPPSLYGFIMSPLSPVRAAAASSPSVYYALSAVSSDPLARLTRTEKSARSDRPAASQPLASRTPEKGSVSQHSAPRAALPLKEQPCIHRPRSRSELKTRRAPCSRARALRCLCEPSGFRRTSGRLLRN